jgi:hypothetical protein
MLAAAGIESGAAGGTLVATGHIPLDAHLISAGAAQYCGLCPLRLRPNLDRMICQSFMAILAGVIDAATFHLYRDNIENGSIVCTARLCVQIDSPNFMA